MNCVAGCVHIPTHSRIIIQNIVPLLKVLNVEMDNVTYRAYRHISRSHLLLYSALSTNRDTSFVFN